jgi:hypothetical protein
MATPVILGVGAVTAALVGRQLLRRSAKNAADQWVKGGFKAKMDRKEAIEILGLKCVALLSIIPSSLRPLAYIHGNTGNPLLTCTSLAYE